MSACLSSRYYPKVCNIYLNQFVRYKGKAIANCTPENVTRALKYFDEFYRPYFGAKWPFIRQALLRPRNYCALLNNFCPTIQIEDELKEIGAVELRKWYEDERTKSSPIVALEAENMKNDKQPVERMFEDFQKDDENSTTNCQTSEEKSNLEEKLLLRKSDLTACTDTNLNQFQSVSTSHSVEDIDKTEHVKHVNETAEMPFKIVKPTDLPFPQLLKIFVFPNNDVSFSDDVPSPKKPFPQPKRDACNLFSYYLMDTASILPVVLLQPRPNDNVLDLCSSPGGKALTVTQTMGYSTMVCNDYCRVKRLRTVFESYIPNEHRQRIKFTAFNAEQWEERNVYSKVLVDVPCTNDRMSASKDSNSIFSQSRLKERIHLPESQTKMLYSALLAVKAGGTVVYSTCSLSPAQNDGVVNMALQKVWQETSSEFVIHDLSDVMKSWNFLFHFHDHTKYGQLVLPYLPLNNGPMYMCKLIRIK